MKGDFSHSMYQELLKAMDRDRPHFIGLDLASGPDMTFMGMVVQPSRLFPINTRCASCRGTGEGGDEATYCPDCTGQGETRTEGIMQAAGQTIVLMTPLPKKFPIRWPKDLSCPPRRVQGIRTVAWPELGK